ncbi:hypothetical protein ZIOFF_065148 [Zingiber officinale]|uniref:Uncharacterized protein n=1 Tax=Zingiber officinale TaxID=94328 RepID=A0A8J5F060_ZINOF|nr:hypothetical protein ZIOFF_065148 [Zingiber officinale]
MDTSYKSETAQTNAAIGGNQTPLDNVDKVNDDNLEANKEQFVDLNQVNLGYSSMQEQTPDTSSVQQSGYVAEKSHALLKSFIGHKSEQLYAYRSLPLGHRQNCYWLFSTSSSPNDPGSGRIFFEYKDGHWSLINSEESVGDHAKPRDSKIMSSPDWSVENGSPNSPPTGLTSDVLENSKSFKIGFEGDDAEKKSALIRHQEHLALCKQKRKSDPDWKSELSNSTLPIRIRLLKAQLSMFELKQFRVFGQAGNPKSWAVKLDASSSAGELSQVLTYFLSSNFKTTAELLSSTGEVDADFFSAYSRTVPVLPWVSDTSAAVALRLLDLDLSISSKLNQKLEFQKEKEGYQNKIPSRYAVVNNMQKVKTRETPEQVDYLNEGRGHGPGQRADLMSQDLGILRKAKSKYTRRGRIVVSTTDKRSLSAVGLLAALKWPELRLTHRVQARERVEHEANDYDDQVADYLSDEYPNDKLTGYTGGSGS